MLFQALIKHNSLRLSGGRISIEKKNLSHSWYDEWNSISFDKQSIRQLIMSLINLTNYMQTR